MLISMFVEKHHDFIQMYVSEKCGIYDKKGKNNTKNKLDGG